MASEAESAKLVGIVTIDWTTGIVAIGVIVVVPTTVRALLSILGGMVCVALTMIVAGPVCISVVVTLRYVSRYHR